MTQAELYQKLKSLGLPIAYGEFSEPIAPPFITYQFAYSGDIMADNQNYADAGFYQVELYTAKKDLAMESLIENKLKELCLPYSKIEAWLDSENLRQIIYEIQLIGG
jgi:hypothetical protein